MGRNEKRSEQNEMRIRWEEKNEYLRDEDRREWEKRRNKKRWEEKRRNEEMRREEKWLLQTQSLSPQDL